MAVEWRRSWKRIVRSSALCSPGLRGGALAAPRPPDSARSRRFGQFNGWRNRGDYLRAGFGGS